jgi:hypothetical protein
MVMAATGAVLMPMVCMIVCVCVCVCVRVVFVML